VVQEKPRKERMKASHKNPKTEVIINKNCRSEGQIMDFSKRRCLSKLHNNNSDLRKELV